MTENESYLSEQTRGKSDVREALILAGIREIEEEGPDRFSLRRVATACGVSCAAPYKHFKSKDAFIAEIVAYIQEKWSLLETHILEVFAGKEECLTELCLASVRFWIANPHFRAVRTMNRTGEDKFSVGEAAEEMLLSRAAQGGATQEQRDELLYTVRSLVTGATLMLEDGTLANTPDTFRMLRRALKRVLPV